MQSMMLYFVKASCPKDLKRALATIESEREENLIGLIYIARDSGQSLILMLNQDTIEDLKTISGSSKKWRFLKDHEYRKWQAVMPNLLGILVTHLSFEDFEMKLIQSLPWYHIFISIHGHPDKDESIICPECGSDNVISQVEEFLFSDNGPTERWECQDCSHTFFLEEYKNDDDENTSGQEFHGSCSQCDWSQTVRAGDDDNVLKIMEASHVKHSPNCGCSGEFLNVFSQTEYEPEPEY